ncbi:capsular polysaccharide export protein, LipB/KpsS family [Proteiniphilum saccharofermentans]|nr:hypothetical protein [Proteiniphilum saccharofermentans]
MKYLILINNAPKMITYHKGLGDSLKRKGNSVIYAFADELPLLTYSMDFSKERIYIFSEYFKVNDKNPLIDNKYSKINWLKTYFSDYDRNRYYSGPTYDNKYYDSLLKNLINFFDTIFQNENIDFFIYEAISNSFAYVCYEVAKVNDIGYRGYIGSRIANRFELHTEEFGMTNRFEKIFKNSSFHAQTPEIKDFVESYLAKYLGNHIPSYLARKNKLTADYSLVKKYINNEKSLLLKGAFKFYKKTKSADFKYAYQSNNPIKYYYNLFKRNILKKIRTTIGNNIFEKPAKDEIYYLFPLHMKPEASTSVLARHYCDDLAVLRNIAFNLPIGEKLYIKEHFVNYGNLPLSFYHELKRIPNVRLIHSNEDTMQLIKNCKALITLTSTMGFEALLMYKKVIVFGNVFYKCHPNCIKLDSYENLFNILTELKQPPCDREVARNFVTAYYLCTSEGRTGFSNYEKEDIGRFAEPLIKAIEIYNHELATQN